MTVWFHMEWPFNKMYIWRHLLNRSYFLQCFSFFGWMNTIIFSLLEYLYLPYIKRYIFAWPFEIWWRSMTQQSWSGSKIKKKYPRCLVTFRWRYTIYVNHPKTKWISVQKVLLHLSPLNLCMFFNSAKSNIHYTYMPFSYENNFKMV